MTATLATEEDALLAACLASPEDMAPRLVYADWLEERGDERHEAWRWLAAKRRVPSPTGWWSGGALRAMRNALPDFLRGSTAKIGRSVFRVLPGTNRDYLSLFVRHWPTWDAETHQRLWEWEPPTWDATLTDREALLAAIVAAPDDDAPRLIFADWLDEHGEEARASFIRVQCELAQATKACWCKGEGRTAKNEFCGRCWPLRSRERELWDAHWLDWFPEVFDPRQVQRGFLATVRGPLGTLIGGECGRCEEFRARRRADPTIGNPGHKCQQCGRPLGTPGRTPGIAGDLFAREPIRRVEFTDREPYPSIVRPKYSWWEEIIGEAHPMHPQSDLPADLYAILPGEELPSGHKEFDTHTAALDALSAAACALARERAGLILSAPPCPSGGADSGHGLP